MIIKPKFGVKYFKFFSVSLTNKNIAKPCIFLGFFYFTSNFTKIMLYNPYYNYISVTNVQLDNSYRTIRQTIIFQVYFSYLNYTIAFLKRISVFFT